METEELVHENERVRAKFKAFEAVLREYLENQRNCCALRSLAHPPHGSSSITRDRSIPTRGCVHRQGPFLVAGDRQGFPLLVRAPTDGPSKIARGYRA